jgi:outer membrane protein assembly factor BamB
VLWRAAALAAWCGFLAACGGGEASTGQTPAPVVPGAPLPAPEIHAQVLATPQGTTLPDGTSNATAIVEVEDAAGAPIASAVVSANGVRIPYDATEHYYRGDLRISLGDFLSVSVTVGSVTYSRSAQHLKQAPVLKSPASGARWGDSVSNDMTWDVQGIQSTFLLAVTDTAGRVIWPASGEYQRATAITYAETVPARSLAPGAYRAFLWQLVVYDSWPDAAPGSYLVDGALAMSPFSVFDYDHSATSLEFELANTAVALGSSARLPVTATLRNGERIDASNAATWSSLDPSKVAVSANGEMTAVSPGRTKVTAEYLEAKTEISVLAFQRTLTDPEQRTQRSSAYQGASTHDGRLSRASGLVFPPSQSWSVSLPGRPSYPVAGPGRTFVSTEAGTLHAFETATGMPLWTYTPPGTAISGPAYDQGRVFITMHSPRALRAFEAATGNILWSFPFDGGSVSGADPVAVNGVVYVIGGDSRLVYAVEASSGELLWSRPGLVGPPTVSDDAALLIEACHVQRVHPVQGTRSWVYIGGCSGGSAGVASLMPWGLHVRSPTNTTPDGFKPNIFDVVTGKPVPNFGDVRWAPVARDASSGYFLSGAALHLAVIGPTLTPIWSFTGDGTLTLAPLRVESTVFIASRSGMVHALDATTGTELWSANSGASVPSGHDLGSRTPSGLGFADGWLLVPTETGLRAWKF